MCTTVVFTDVLGHEYSWTFLFFVEGLPIVRLGCFKYVYCGMNCGHRNTELDEIATNDPLLNDVYGSDPIARCYGAITRGGFCYFAIHNGWRCMSNYNPISYYMYSENAGATCHANGIGKPDSIYVYRVKNEGEEITGKLLNPKPDTTIAGSAEKQIVVEISVGHGPAGKH